ncbi:MAG: udp-n-acetylglucosamine transporter yea4 [Lasallia pustulata]|uniref:Udp-n-acetylglucosamine transporter yea4 n=1 Tax=Lasallia pustulata TaxID=136370 RepID=A0A5M8PMI1_9LECA|nr:MAG: udp-n-acetylglucosamine transporter yea4 [Lasallia pustulata]
MAKGRKSNASTADSNIVASSQTNMTRRRDPMTPPPATGVTLGPKKIINAAPSLQNSKPGLYPNARLTIPRAIGIAGAKLEAACPGLFSGLLPALFSWGLTVGLIFGGCCSNVYTLEAIVKDEPDSGFLLTFTQFVVTALFTWPAHFSASHPPFYLKPRAVPLTRWIPNIVLFWVVNVLNNLAFRYRISVPIHIILRSGGSVTTMLVGFCWGNRYSRVRVISVALLTVGITLAAYSDAQSKGKTNPSLSDSPNSTASFVTGLLILLIAQILSAVMGLYTQKIYSQYGSHWLENLFYIHSLSLPLFLICLPFLPFLRLQVARLASSPSIFIFPSTPLPKAYLWKVSPFFFAPFHHLVPYIKLAVPITQIRIPSLLAILGANALTQYLCIRGVNMLGARTSALGVSIVLNIRKLISLLISIWLFGNQLPLGVLAGAGVVFGSGALYAWDGGSDRGRRMGRKKSKSY